MIGSEAYKQAAIAAGFLDPLEGIEDVKRSSTDPNKFWLLVKDPEKEGYYVTAFFDGDYAWNFGETKPLEEAEAEFEAKE